MPAKNRLKLRKYKLEKNERFIFILKILALFLFVLLLYFSLARNFWKSGSKMVLTIANTDGSARVVTLDPINSQINDYLVPGTTELEVSRGLGVWKLKSIWNLGVQEKIGGGELLVETLTKHANIPTFVYSEEVGYGLLSTNFKSIFQAIVYPNKTNLSLGDKLAIVSFTFKVKNTKRIELDLSKTSYLTKKSLVDGESGFVVSRVLPQSVLLVFANHEISQNFSKFVINDSTGSAGFSDRFSSILEVTGGKVLLVSKDKKEQMFCEVRSKKRSVSVYLAKLLGCKREAEIIDGNFDVEITVGERFSDQF